jgi:TolA-binding protein/predicted  nucleic acid-binding Zn-ribbon protein
MTPRLLGGVLGALLALIPLKLQAESADRLDGVASSLTSIEDEVAQLQRNQRSEDLAGPRHVEERLTDAELLFNMQDYTRASILYLDVVENYPNHPGFPEALLRLAECLFNTQNYYGARTRYREVLDRAADPLFRGFAQSALGRLIEIAIHLDQFDGIETYFTRLSQLPPTDVTSATHYARGRFLYHQEEYDAAAQAFALVGQNSDEHLRAQYHLAVIRVAQREFREAIQIFTQISRTEAESMEDRQVVDLSHVAIGALHLELDQPEEAIRSYQNVNRNSRHFDQALYQAAAAYSRMGDSTRAERALEVLTVAAPDSHYIPRAKILRGNLLLETGRYSDARDVFHDVIREYRPVREELEEVLRRERDPAAYFQELVRANMEVFDVASFLPPLAVRWVREEEGFRRAMETLARTADCTRQLAETELLLTRLEAAVAGPSAVNIFPDLRGSAINAIQIENRLSILRNDVLIVEQGLSGGGGELDQVRAERRRLEDELRGLPSDPESYEARESEARSELQRLARDLSRMNAQIDRLQAMVVAIELYLRQNEPETEAEQEGMLAFQEEIRVHRNAIDTYREELTSIRTMVGTGQIQIGLGDEQDRRDRNLRQRFNELARREHRLASREAAGGAARRASELFDRIEAVQRNLDGLNLEIVRRAQTQSAELQEQLHEERGNLGRYEGELASLEEEAEEVIGHAAYQNFHSVRDRFYDLVRQADVGIIDVAWAEREEHRHRIDSLSDESRVQLQMLDDEFRDVMEEQTAEGADAR